MLYQDIKQINIYFCIKKKQYPIVTIIIRSTNRAFEIKYNSYYNLVFIKVIQFKNINIPEKNLKRELFSNKFVQNSTLIDTSLNCQKIVPLIIIYLKYSFKDFILK